MRIEYQIQVAISTNDIKKAKTLFKKIEEDFIQINVYTILNLATFYATPEMIELVLDKMKFELTDNILIRTLRNINGGYKEYFENYKTFINIALEKVSNYLIEEEIIVFCKKESKNKYDIMYKEEFFNVISKEFFKGKINYEIVNAFENKIKKDKMKLNLKDF